MDPVEERSRREYASRMERTRDGGRRVRGSLILELLGRMSLVKVVAAAALILGAGDAGAVVTVVILVGTVGVDDAAVIGGAGLDRAAVLLSRPPPPRVGEGEGSRDRGALLLGAGRFRPRMVHVPSLEGGVVVEAA